MLQGGVFPHLGREIEFEALGKRWKLARLTMAVWASVWDWVKPRLPDPFDGLERFVDKATTEQFAQLVTRAQERQMAMRSLDSPEVQALLSTLEGKIEQFYCQLKVHHPDVTRDQAFEILAAVGEAEVAKLKTQTSGEPPDLGNAAAPAG